MSIPSEEVGGSVRSGLYALGRIVKDDRALRLLRGAVVASLAWDAGRKAYGALRRETAYTVTLNGTDDIYDDVHAWLLAQLPPKRRRALTARSRRGSSDGPTVMQEGPTARDVGQLLLRYDGSRAHTLAVDGHRIRVEVLRDRDVFTVLSDRDYADAWGPSRDRIVFTASSAAGRDAVTAFLTDTARLKHADTVHRFYMATRWGDWRRRNDLPSRPLDTVILREGQVDGLVADLREFLNAEEAYARLGIPWHRGYLFHGPPGTGKTSLAKALAQEFELDVYYVALSDITADTNLLSMLGSIEPRSMLVLEDIDVVHAAKSRDDSESPQSISLSGLLNALDGFATPHGLVTVMTTNDMSVLDPALIRPGRADRIEELGYLDDDQLARLATLILDRETYRPLPSLKDRQLTHAEVVEAAKPHLQSGRMHREAALYAVVRSGRPSRVRSDA